MKEAKWILFIKMLHKVCVDMHTPFQNSLTERKRVSMIKLSEGWELTPNQQTYHIFSYFKHPELFMKNLNRSGGRGQAILQRFQGF